MPDLCAQDIMSYSIVSIADHTQTILPLSLYSPSHTCTHSKSRLPAHKPRLKQQAHFIIEYRLHCIVTGLTLHLDTNLILCTEGPLDTNIILCREGHLDTNLILCREGPLDTNLILCREGPLPVCALHLDML